MSLSNPTRLAIWLSLMVFFSSSLAQNTTSTSRCPSVIGTLSPNAHVNSTGMRSFQWTDEEQDWYLTSTLNDSRSSFLTSQLHDVQGYISAPMDTDTKACVFTFEGLNATAGGDSGCEGVLSQNCIDFLTRNLTFPSSQTGEKKCKAPALDQIREACGDQMSDASYSSSPIDFSNHTCSIFSPPANDMPSEYLTWPVMGLSAAPGNSDRFPDNFTYYDRYVRQPRPWVVAGSMGQTKVLCIAPDQLVGETRTPNGAWPPNSRGVGLMRWSEELMPVVLVVAASVILMVQ